MTHDVADKPIRPWSFDPTNPFIPAHGGEIRDEHGKSVCFVDSAETAERIVRAVNGESNWQPIDAAPLDGTRVNLCWKADGGLGAHVELGKYSRVLGVWCNTYGKCFSGHPDYFQLLPDVPVAA